MRARGSDLGRSAARCVVWVIVHGLTVRGEWRENLQWLTMQIAQERGMRDGRETGARRGSTGGKGVNER